MNGTIHNQTIDSRDVFIYTPPGFTTDGGPYPFIVAVGETPEHFAPVAEILEQKINTGEIAPFILAGTTADWDRELTPWPAPAVFRGAADFGGEGERYLDFLTQKLVPAIQREWPVCKDPADTAVMGYSLAGLFSLYALFNTAVFGRAASVSGSLWYPGWTEYIKKQPLQAAGARVYLSLGLGEEKSRNPVMATVRQATEETQAMFQNLTGREVPLVFSAGGHFTEAEARKAAAILWMMKK